MATVSDSLTLDPATIAAFRDVVYGYWRTCGRHDLPWRQTRDPYAVLVSEVMLQQTQVARVIPRFDAWLERFPSIDALAAAPLTAVLEQWQGLGYNRRAIALKRTAEGVSFEMAGVLPDTEAALRALPGIGPATAAGVVAFAHGAPAVYLETNVRAVYLHHFFADRDSVPDREIIPIVAATLHAENPRDWYYALLDYGVHLKSTLPNPSRRSRHHTTQSTFQGSRRQKRAMLLRGVLAEPGMTSAALAEALGLDERLTDSILDDLASEGFLVCDDGRYAVA
ncbi:MAG: adenine glycosylase [Actinomycetota bacterium]|nr:adenine glycosylase [Actinomycetota bacterium]